MVTGRIHLSSLELYSREAGWNKEVWGHTGDRRAAGSLYRPEASPPPEKGKVSGNPEVLGSRPGKWAGGARAEARQVGGLLGYLRLWLAGKGLLFCPAGRRSPGIRRLPEPGFLQTVA